MNRYQQFHKKSDWENIDVTSINREISHAHWGAYENEIQAETCDRTISKWTMSLDGKWKFSYYSKPALVEPFWEAHYDHSNLKLKPVAHEVKQIYCPIVFEKIISDNPWALDPDFGNFMIKNRNLVLDTACYKVIYTIRENGYAIKSGIYELPLLKAGEEVKASFTEDFDKKTNAEYHVEFSIQYAADMAFAEAGFELGCYQFVLHSGAYQYTQQVESSADEEISLHEETSSLKVTGTNFNVKFDKTTGLITSYTKDGVDYIKGGPVECLLRPASGIDCDENWGRYSIWNTFDPQNIEVALKSFCYEKAGSSKVIVEIAREVKFTNNPYAVMVLTNYTIFTTGDIKVDTVFRIDPTLKDLPRVGAELVIAQGFEDITYFGYGPVENYSDRKHAAKLGVFNSTVESEHFPFIPPSENGGHEEARWIIFKDKAGRSIKIASDIPFHFDVHHNIVPDYKQAKHEHQLIRRPESYLHIDAAHSGIGSDMGWSSFLDVGDRVKAQNYRLSYVITFE
jgi:beta-galactosidase